MTRLKILFLANLAKLLAAASVYLKKGSGTALPGLLVERRFLDILQPIAAQFEEIIFISGTNGKTTTRAILVDIYEKNGISVCTNRGGANILRGIASTLLLNLDKHGKVTSRVAILEVEEASMPKLAKYVWPDTVILTNIFRDQLDAYGEIDQTIRYFRQALNSAPSDKSPKLIINADDHKLLSAATGYQGEIYGFGLNIPEAKKPDFEDKNQTYEAVDLSFNQKFTGYSVRTNSFQVVTSDNLTHKLITQLPGIYNLYNVLAAFIVGYSRFQSKAIAPVLDFKPVFGRGENIELKNGKKIDLFLVKNPAGFNQVLEWLKDSKPNKTPLNLLVLINDNIADGRDVSWLWDCDIESFVLNHALGQVFTAGTRGLDMLLRLEYAGAKVKLEHDLVDLKTAFFKIAKSDQDFVVLSTYTALLEFRNVLSQTLDITGITEKGN